MMHNGNNKPNRLYDNTKAVQPVYSLKLSTFQSMQTPMDATSTDLNKYVHITLTHPYLMHKLVK